MRLLSPGIANTIWQYLSLMPWRQFHRACKRLEDVQLHLLSRYVATNQNTIFGRRHDFNAIQSIHDYQNKVPLSDYDDYGEYIDAISHGQSNVLTAEPVFRFEITSGSVSASKLIPYTHRMRSEFQRAIAVWIVDLFRNNPDLKKGPAYWSITPLVDKQTVTPAGIPIGYEEDSAYLGRLGKNMVEIVMAVPNVVKNIREIESFRYLTLLFLLQQPDLRIISIWNPTYLSLLLDQLPRHWQDLVKDIAHGTITTPGDLPPELRAELLNRISPNPERGKGLESLHPEEYTHLWPKLGLVSCWMDAGAHPHVDNLKARFPGVTFQGKGLIATEAFISFPITGVWGGVLACTSHFFEFLPTDPDTFEPTTTKTMLAHQLEIDQTYAVIVTTGGGLYRYQMYDVVQVVDFLDQTPCFRFLGKSDNVSDQYGEKLNERFVTRILEELMQEYALKPRFAMLAPDEKKHGTCYTLYLELPHIPLNKGSLRDISSQLDRKLRQNFHYDYCRRLGQLGPPGLCLVKQGATEAFLQACESRGQRLGNIKPVALHRSSGWGNIFGNLSVGG